MLIQDFTAVKVEFIWLSMEATSLPGIENVESSANKVVVTSELTTVGRSLICVSEYFAFTRLSH